MLINLLFSHPQKQYRGRNKRSFEEEKIFIRYEMTFMRRCAVFDQRFSEFLFVGTNMKMFKLRDQIN
jgi:hypothetical protein